MKENKAKNKRHYKFTDKKHSIPGIVSTGMALVAIFLVVLAVSISFGERGGAGIGIGLLGFFAFVIGLAGFVVGMKSFKNEDVFHLFSYVGTVLSTAVWFCILFIYLIGV
ncbi:DUF6142 family protein [Parasporobacterium paucivorans]|uniref:Uncharacterized protein n=1 Tax=Parasporobacterium paucivorans DSM 15970 TaxID=1122934 RepID=A0A1M6HIH2_9FIRM|nr:DUF6142 family protein [Parasporobacterium paucivorans]SHJ21939.1 hypothetical protein SAMN02745691_01541 [Parasporobacterium paucivorans DSM 15970]